MKKFTVLLTTLMLVTLALFSLTAQAAESSTAKVSTLAQIRAGAKAAGLQGQTAGANLPKVAVLYLNNAKTTYDNEVDQRVLSDLGKALPETKYTLVDGDPYLAKLSKMGIADLSTAERGDIVDAFKGEDVDYCLFIEVQPFVARDKVTFFTIGKDITAVVPFKIIDLANNKYFYNGKFTEKSSDSTVIGLIGNKSVALQALSKIDKQMATAIDEHLPTTRPAK